MKTNISFPCTGEIEINKIKINRTYEFVERKGSGHPDTLADELAERLSIEYSNYCLNKFGIVLHHNFDKVGILGGSSFVKFGEGYLTSPLRVLINGRVSVSFGNKKIPFLELIEKTTKNYLKSKFPMIDVSKDIKIQDNLSTKSSPGKTDLISKKEGTRKNWFEPRNKKDIKELEFLGSNDTSMGVGFAPLTNFEKLVLDLEDSFNKSKFRKNNPWLGTDIKIMASKINKRIDLTMCVPQISKYVLNEAEYKDNLNFIRVYTKNFIESKFPEMEIQINLNTRDNFETGELYLTAIGSSIESGDEGLVGRGNRINRLICQTKPYTMEGAAGKNPVYHVGKVYSYAANKIAEKVSKLVGAYTEVFLISQSGRLLIDPWKTVMGIEKDLSKKEIAKIEYLVRKELKKIPIITDEIIKSKYKIA